MSKDDYGAKCPIRDKCKMFTKWDLCFGMVITHTVETERQKAEFICDGVDCKTKEEAEEIGQDNEGEDDYLVDELQDQGYVEVE